MLGSIFKVVKDSVKSWLGLHIQSDESRKRPHASTSYDFDEDVSDDELEYSVEQNKRRKLDKEVERTEMADWCTARQGFGESFYFKKLKSSDSSASSKTEQPSMQGRNLPSSKSSEKERNVSLGSKRNLSAQFEIPIRSEWNLPRQSEKRLSFSQPVEKINCTRSALNDENGQSENDLYSRHTTKGLSKRIDFSKFASFTLNGNLKIKQPQQNSYSSHQINMIRPNSTVKACIQLEEKEKYKKLLNRYNLHILPKELLLPKKSNILKQHEVIDLTEEFPENHQEKRKEFTLHRLDSSEMANTRERILHSTPLVRQKLKFSDDSLINEASENSSLEQQAEGSDSPVFLKEVPIWRKDPLSENTDCPFTSKKWLNNWRQRLEADKEETNRKIEELKRNISLKKSTWGKAFDVLETNIREQLQIAENDTEVIEEIFIKSDEEVEEIEDAEKEPMPELTAEMEKKIDDALRPVPPDEILVDSFRIQIRRRDMETLQDLNWLNDSIINFYMNLLMERGKLDNMPSVYACNTFFYPKLIQSGHESLKRWTRKVDIFAHDFILVPVHLGVHWCLAVIDFKKKNIKYYDSMGGKNNDCLKALCNYLKEERLDKKKEELAMSDWTLENVTDAPQQMNSSDCGMFACKYAEYITRNAKITFKQNHMPYFRRRMVYEILTTHLL